MITPVFELNQSDTFLTIIIKATYCKISDAEIYIEENDFKFYAKPYYLRLNLPGALVEDGRESAKYDSDTGSFTVKVAKANPGQIFEGLDMLTKLLSPLKQASASIPAIEVVQNEGHVDAEVEDEMESEIDWQIEQVPYMEPELSTDGPKYGFVNRRCGVFTRIQSEFPDLIDLKDADMTPWIERKTYKREHENQHFNEDHYMADFIDEEQSVRSLLHFKPVWQEEMKSLENDSPLDTFTTEEKEQMLKLPRKEYILDVHEQQIALLSLVDIMFGYVYNHIITEGENNVESGWNICKVSSTLSWLDIPGSLEEVIRNCYRRCLCYPLYRSWKLINKVLKEVCNVFSHGRVRVVKSLLDIHSILQDSDQRYVLNDLYITDYCVWIQSIRHKSLDNLVHHLKKIKLKKSDVGFDLETIEYACTLVQEEHNSSCLLAEEIKSLQLTGNSTETNNSKDIDHATSEFEDLASSTDSETDSEYESDNTSSGENCASSNDKNLTNVVDDQLVGNKINISTNTMGEKVKCLSDKTADVTSLNF